MSAVDIRDKALWPEELKTEATRNETEEIFYNDMYCEIPEKNVIPSLKFSQTMMSSDHSVVERS